LAVAAMASQVLAKSRIDSLNDAAPRGDGRCGPPTMGKSIRKQLQIKMRTSLTV
jgi:hypothetical protein